MTLQPSIKRFAFKKESFLHYLCSLDNFLFLDLDDLVLKILPFTIPFLRCLTVLIHLMSISEYILSIAHLKVKLGDTHCQHI